jgi:hypothetical protein
MSEAGHRLLQVLADGQPRTVRQLAQATHCCQRLTRATTQGCVVAGLCALVPDTAPVQVVITDAGLDAMNGQ